MYRILHLTSVHSRTDNRIFNKECRALAAAGFQVHAAVADGGRSTNGAVNLIGLPRERTRLRRAAFSSFRMWRVLWCLKPDIMHIHDPELIPLLLLWKLTQRRTVVIYDAHEDFVVQSTRKSYIPKPLRFVVPALSRAMMCAVDRVSDGVVAATDTVASRFTRTEVVVVENYPWRAEYSVEPSPAPHQRVGEEIKLCYVGAISRSRGAREMAELLDRLESSERKAQLIIAGPIQDDAGKKLVARPDVNYRGVVDSESVPDILRGAQIGLALLAPLPNYKKAMPTKVFEYMAAGLPFVASNFDLWESLFGRHQAGLLVNPESAAAVVNAVTSLADDPVRSNLMGENGVSAIEHELNFEIASYRLLGFVRHLLAGGSGPVRSS